MPTFKPVYLAVGVIVLLVVVTIFGVWWYSQQVGPRPPIITWPYKSFTVLYCVNETTIMVKNTGANALDVDAPVYKDSELIGYITFSENPIIEGGEEKEEQFVSETHVLTDGGVYGVHGSPYETIIFYC